MKSIIVHTYLKLKSILIFKLKFILISIARKGASQTLNDRNISVLCNNCVGAMLCHDFGMRFNSPTVNLWMYPKDYILLLKNLDIVANDELIEVKSEEPCPVGKLKKLGIIIFFLHYKDFASAKEKWESRVKRLNLDNIYAILVERDGCTVDDIKVFDSLNFKKKIAIVHRLHGSIPSEVKINGYENESQVGLITGKTPDGYFHYYDKLNWFNFLGLSRSKMFIKGLINKIRNK